LANGESQLPLSGENVTLIFNPDDTVQLTSSEQGMASYDQEVKPDLSHEGGMISIRSDQGSTVIMRFFQVKKRLILADPTSGPMIPLDGESNKLYVTLDRSAELTEGLVVNDGHVFESCQQDCARMMLIALGYASPSKAPACTPSSFKAHDGWSYYQTYRLPNGWGVGKMQGKPEDGAQGFDCKVDEKTYFVDHYGQVTWDFGHAAPTPTAQPVEPTVVEPTPTTPIEPAAAPDNSQTIESRDEPSSEETNSDDGSSYDDSPPIQSSDGSSDQGSEVNVDSGCPPPGCDTGDGEVDDPLPPAEMTPEMPVG
jgi:hypothetical protein